MKMKIKKLIKNKSASTFKKFTQNHHGFTLLELLTVIAIIAILIAISLPLFNSVLEKAKQRTDVANERNAKALATVTCLSDGLSNEQTYYFDAESGTLKKTVPEFKYGQSKQLAKDTLVTDKSKSTVPYKGYIYLKVSESATKDLSIQLLWGGGEGSASSIPTNEIDNNLLKGGMFDKDYAEIHGTTTIKFFKDEWQVLNIDKAAHQKLKGVLNLDPKFVNIQHYAFEKCTGITEINLPSTLRRVEKYAFEGMTGLEKISFYNTTYFQIPEMLSSCKNLKTIEFHGTEQQWKNLNLKIPSGANVRFIP